MDNMYMTDEQKIDRVLNYYETEISKDYLDISNCDFRIYTDITADGYTIHIASDYNGDGKVYPSEHIYYHSNSLAEIFIKEMKNKHQVIFIEEDLYLNMNLDSVLIEEYEELFEQD